MKIVGISIRTLGIVLLLAGAQVSCSKNKSGADASSSSRPMASYCSNTTSVSDPVTFSGTAKYQYRIDGNGQVADGLAGRASPNPIRYAEVRVLDSNGTLAQCGETDGSGNFSVQVPRDTGTYTIKITSRANNAQYKAYVMTNPTDNEYHSISTEASSSGDSSGLTLTALATGTLEGGAFNILDQILKANEFLRAQTAGCSSTFSECTPFSTAPIIYAYWSKGVNPGIYQGLTSSISYYLPGKSQLYLMGGLNGDVDSSDTDHFDNSVIIHEYGHFIEDIYAETDSPGGSHNGNSVIDPRLAWGEGWANFFQAAVTGVPVYRDTWGNVSGNTGIYFSENLETGVKDTPSSDAANAGEGMFREFSITRILWDAIDSHPATYAGPGSTTITSDADSVDSDFALLWTVFTGTSNGFKSSDNRFRHIGLFHKVQQAIAADNWSSIRSSEKHSPGDLTYFATPITLGGACTNTASIQAVATSDGSFPSSNLLRNNDFYYYYHSGGALSLQLAYTTSGSAADLDLLLWKDGYTYGRASDLAARSDNSSDGGTERINQTIAAGHYMINVMVYTGNGTGGTSTYTLTINGQKACPNP